jgi:hypothetical protein
MHYNFPQPILRVKITLDSLSVLTSVFPLLIQISGGWRATSYNSDMAKLGVRLPYYDDLELCATGMVHMDLRLQSLSDTPSRLIWVGSPFHNIGSTNFQEAQVTFSEGDFVELDGLSYAHIYSLKIRKGKRYRQRAPSLFACVCLLYPNLHVTLSTAFFYALVSLARQLPFSQKLPLTPWVRMP